MTIMKNEIDYNNFQTVGEYYSAVRDAGKKIPLEMCRGLSQTMQGLNLTFPQAYELLVDRKAIILVNNHE